MKTKISRQNICFTVPGCPHANWKFHNTELQQQIRLIHLQINNENKNNTY